MGVSRAWVRATQAMHKSVSLCQSSSCRGLASMTSQSTQVIWKTMSARNNRPLVEKSGNINIRQGQAGRWQPAPTHRPSKLGAKESAPTRTIVGTQTFGRGTLHRPPGNGHEELQSFIVDCSILHKVVLLLLSGSPDRSASETTQKPSAAASH